MTVMTGDRNGTSMRERGFTLTELIIVIILAGVLATIATPTFSTNYGRTATRTAVDQFVSIHTLARSIAVQYGRTAELHIDNSTGRFWVEVDTTSTFSGAKIRVGALRDIGKGGVTMASDRALLCFDSRGFPTSRGSCESADATIIFTRLEHSNTVEVTPLGRVLR